MKKVFMPIERDSENDMKVIGQKIAQWRYEMGLSQYNVADAIGLSRNGIDKIEKGKCAPKITTLLNLCAAFSVPLSTFLPDDIAAMI